MTQHLLITPALIKALAFELDFHGLKPSAGQKPMHDIVSASLASILTKNDEAIVVDEASMPQKVSSDELSSLAAKYMNLTGDTVFALAGSGVQGVEELARNVRRIAASVVSQDENLKTST